MSSPYNSTHVEFDSLFFNETILNEYNYTIYENGTLSNSSKCWLVFDPYEAFFLPNGTVVNGTNCDVPINNIATRGILGIVFGALYALMIVLALVQLRKHGATHLPLEKRFRLVSRRWMWYWLIVAATCGIISTLTAVDVDRDYMPGTSIILQNVFFFVMMPAALASVWEMTRHWGSFCERQLVDEDAFRFSDDDRRSKIEFYIPLVFYLFAFLTFFLSVLRTWTQISKGQYNGYAIRDATDGRFKASAIFSLVAVLITIASIHTTIKYYRPVSRLSAVPLKLPLSVFFILIRVGYTIACAWEFVVSPLDRFSSSAYIYPLGYLPILLVMIAQIAGGYREMNEDLKIKQLRRERERRLDFEMGQHRDVEKEEREEREKKMQELKKNSDTVQSTSTAQSGKSSWMLDV